MVEGINEGRRKRVAYIASPLGFSEAGIYFLRLLRRRLSKFFIIIDPWEYVLSRDIRSVRRENERLSRDQLISIGRKNEERIRSADVVIAVLDGPQVDDGTASEVGFAYGIGKRVYGYRGDLRRSGESCASAVNLQVEAFIIASGGRIFGSLEDMLDYFEKYYTERPRERQETINKL